MHTMLASEPHVQQLLHAFPGRRHRYCRDPHQAWLCGRETPLITFEHPTAEAAHRRGDGPARTFWPDCCGNVRFGIARLTRLLQLVGTAASAHEATRPRERDWSVERMRGVLARFGLASASRGRWASWPCTRCAREHCREFPALRRGQPVAGIVAPCLG